MIVMRSHYHIRIFFFCILHNFHTFCKREAKWAEMIWLQANTISLCFPKQKHISDFKVGPFWYHKELHEFNRLMICFPEQIFEFCDQGSLRETNLVNKIAVRELLFLQASHLLIVLHGLLNFMLESCWMIVVFDWCLVMFDSTYFGKCEPSKELA